MAHFSIEPIEKEEISFFLERALEEGWNPGLHDGKPFFQADPKGFFVGKWGKEPIGCISAIAYGHTFGFIGFYILRPQWRGQGYGIRLWKTAMDHLGERNIGLDGVLLQISNYEKSGFRLAYQNIRFESGYQESDDKELLRIDSLPFEEIFTYDRRFFPAPRKLFLQDWLSMPQSFGYGAKEEGKLVGYGLIRKCHKGYKIGPLFADRADIAERLYKKLSSHAENEIVYLDIPEPNSAALALAQKYKMKEVFRTARMYSKETPNIDLNAIFGVTTFELG